MADRTDLSNCDREPIHIPGTIQPHGCLIACDARLDTILRHSVNAQEFLGLSSSIENGLTLASVLGARVVHDLRNAIARSPGPATPGALIAYALPSGMSADVSVHSYKGHAIVEFERSDGAAPQAPLETVQTLISHLRRSSSTEDVVAKTARMLRSVLGYDRVMIYKFAHDGSGRVVSEAKRHDLESFQGQHFPASDIPRQARDLYLKNTLRIIGNAGAQRVAIDPAVDSSGEPIDLSYTHLRSVSPIHCEYLRNMGVAASMSISIIVGGELWGLIACHHYSPRTLSMSQRVAVAMFGEFFSMHLETVLHKHDLDTAVQARQALDHLMGEVTYHDDVQSFLRNSVGKLQQIIASDGIGLWLDGAYTSNGLTPPAQDIPELARFLNGVSDSKVWASHDLSRHFPNAIDYVSQASGVLAVPLSQIPNDYLLFFRKEVLQTVEWGGNPNKHYATGEFGERLTPRKSFAIWKEMVVGQSRPWSDADREIAKSIRTAFLEVLMRQEELLSTERQKAAVRQKLLNEELNHRVKNVLSLIKSLVSQPVEEGANVSDYAQSLKKRILALAFAHDQVVRSDGGGNLRQLLEAELSPYFDQPAQIAIDGPQVGLDARSYSVLALVFHELATNAAKYGALSVPDGRLQISWKITDTGACELYWREAGGPAVTPPRRRGFGSTLIDRSVPFDLGGESDVKYASKGLEARLLIPAKFVADALSESPTRWPTAPTHVISNTLAGKRVLLVEDQLVIALEAENILSERGAHVDTAATVPEALRIIERAAPDLAMLDVNLGTGMSFEIADELQRRGIPYIFATGYGNDGAIPSGYAQVPVVRKPYQPDSLLERLNRLQQQSRH